MKLKEFITQYDKQDQFTVLKETWKQIEFAWSNPLPKFSFTAADISKVVISGLGGSAISGDLLKNFLKDDLKLPVVINRNYSIPEFCDKNTLFIASSYSGNTEETISSLNEAISKKCKIVCVSTGGTIQKIAKDKSLPFINLQKGFQPRYALGVSFFTLLKLFQELKIVSKQNTLVDEIKKLWKSKAKEYSEEENIALKFAERLAGFIPVIYSVSDFTNSVGNRFKSQLNENSKVHAFHHEFPEMNHNEIIGWESHHQKNFHTKIIYLLDKSYHKQVIKRFDIVHNLIQKADVEILGLSSDAKNFKVRIMDLIFLVDWISFYLGVIRGFDPSEIDYINHLKSNLTQ